MSIYRTHCALRLGDNLQALQFLRAMAKANPGNRFIHYAHLHYIPNLIEVVCDLTNLQVCDIESVSEPVKDYWAMKPRELLGSVDTWKNASGDWETHPDRNDYIKHSYQHWREVGIRLGLRSALLGINDLIFDYPALLRGRANPFDVLIINSPPLSGQCKEITPEAFDVLIENIAQRHSVITTHPTRFEIACTQNTMMTVSQIGSLSRFCKYVIGYATGPFWPTLNAFNRDTVQFRLVLLDHERINVMPNTEHCATIAEARRILEFRGIL